MPLLSRKVRTCGNAFGAETQAAILNVGRASFFEVKHKPLAPEAKLRLVLERLGKILRLGRVFAEIEELFFAVESVKDVLHASIGKGVPVIAR